MIKLYFDNGAEEKLNCNNLYPDHTLNLKFPDVNADLCGICWNYESDAELFALICIRKHYNEKVVLTLPYIPHARMDRVKNKTDNFSLKHFCDVINWLDFEKVFVFDPHSNVSVALLNNVVVIDNSKLFKWAVRSINSDNLVAFYPDEGSMKRYSGNSDLPYTFGYKLRNWEDGKILSYKILDEEMVKGKDVVIVDDICSRGGTFFHAANALKEAGAANIYLVVSHCEDTISLGSIFYNKDLIKDIFTTNSIFTIDTSRVKVLEDF